MPGHRKEGSVTWPIRPFSILFRNLTPFQPTDATATTARLPPSPFTVPPFPCRPPDSHALFIQCPSLTLCLSVSWHSVDVERLFHEWTRLPFLPPFLLALRFTLIRIPNWPSPYHRKAFWDSICSNNHNKLNNKNWQQTYSKTEASNKQTNKELSNKTKSKESSTHTYYNTQKAYELAGKWVWE